MKKFIIILLFLCLIISTLNHFKKRYVLYPPFNLPGKQMAITFPPFGVFIESDYKYENIRSPCSILAHENVHWIQYERMGLFNYYYNYLKTYFKKGRVNNWMEEEARRPCKLKAIEYSKYNLNYNLCCFNLQSTQHD